jgi:hypothetical protein
MTLGVDTCQYAHPAVVEHVISTPTMDVLKTMERTQEIIDTVWQHARTMPEADPSLWRQDMCGAWIRRDQFARHDSDFGWKIENVKPGSADTPENLRPFHWRNRYNVANHSAHCEVKADRDNVPSGEFASPPHNHNV